MCIRDRFYSVKYNVPSDLVVSIANAESRFNPSAQSKAGALGVMQVMWKVHNGMLRAKGIAPTRDHMFDPEPVSYTHLDVYKRQVEDAELFQHLQRRGFHKEVDALGDGVGFDEAAAFLALREKLFITAGIKIYPAVRE